jgi:aminotransferase
MSPDALRTPLSARSAHLRETSLLRALTTRVQAFDDGINLGQGICDLEMPGVLREAAIRSIRSDRATYTAHGGLRELRQEIVARTKRRYGLSYGVEDVGVTIGSSAAWFAALMALTDPGDEVIVFEPFYPYHMTAALLAGACVRTVPLDPEAGGVDWAALEDSLSERTRVVMVNTPGNPLGKVWSPEEIDRLAGLLATSPAWVVTDEIYEDLVYDGRAHLPPAAHPDLFERTVTISGLSKAYSITGWRLGWFAAPPALAGAIGPVFDVICVCAPRPLQKAAAVALCELPETYYTDMRDAYARRRRLLGEALRGGGFEPRVPEGAYYMLADYTGRYGRIPPDEACFRLLDETHVAAIPGTLFYAGEPPPVLRFQFAVEEPVIAEVGRRLGAPRA